MEKGYSIASNGYMLVRVGKDHHLADVRGYAYEHRVVAEQKIGAGRQEIASRSGKGLGAIASALSKMKAVGLVVNPRYGVWRLPE